MIAKIEISENGIVWDCETNKLLGHYPQHLPITEALTLLSELRLQLPKIEGVIDALRKCDRNGTADILDQAIKPLLAVREQSEVINERLVA